MNKFQNGEQNMQDSRSSELSRVDTGSVEKKETMSINNLAIGRLTELRQRPEIDEGELEQWALWVNPRGLLISEPGNTSEQDPQLLTSIKADRKVSEIASRVDSMEHIPEKKVKDVVAYLANDSNRLLTQLLFRLATPAELAENPHENFKIAAPELVAAILRDVQPEAVNLIIASLKLEERENTLLLEKIGSAELQKSETFKKVSIVVDGLRKIMSETGDTINIDSTQTANVSSFKSILNKIFEYNPLLFDRNPLVARHGLRLSGYPAWVSILFTKHPYPPLRKAALDNLNTYSTNVPGFKESAIRLSLIQDPDTEVKLCAAKRLAHRELNPSEVQLILQVLIDTRDEKLAEIIHGSSTSLGQPVYDSFRKELQSFIEKNPKYANELPVMAIGESWVAKLSRKLLRKLPKKYQEIMRAGFKKAVENESCPGQILDQAEMLFKKRS